MTHHIDISIVIPIFNEEDSIGKLVDQILDWFQSGEKLRENWLIGTEHEKFLFKKNNYQRLKYKEKFASCNNSYGL